VGAIFKQSSHRGAIVRNGSDHWFIVIPPVTDVPVMLKKIRMRKKSLVYKT